jgi:hypothetical protein
MRRVLAITLTALAGPALAAEGMELPLQSRSQVAASSSSVAALSSSVATLRHADAPFRSSRDPMPEISLREELETRGPKGACEATRADLCYDLRDGKIVYRPAREYMPKIGGLRAESISVRRSGVTFKYSF